MSRSTIDTLLSDEHHAEFLRRARRGAITDVHAWLTLPGYAISRSAVARKLASLRPILSPEAIAREQASGTSNPTDRTGRPASLQKGVGKLRAALPYIFDRDLRAKVEDYARLIETLIKRQTPKD